MKILIDTREQKTWHFGDLAEVSRGTIKQGDYSLLGDEMNFAIERKNLDDFIGTISSGWERFKRELDRMKTADFPSRIIIVESDIESVCYVSELEKIRKPNHNHFKIRPEFVFKRIAELSYNGVSVLFGGNSEYSAFLCYRILKVRENYLKNVRIEL